MDRDAWIDQPLGAEALDAEPPVAPERPARPTVVASGTTTFSVSLPSSLAGLTFEAQFTADWAEEDGGGLGHPDPEAVVRHAVCERASRITARASVTEYQRVLDELNTRLGFAAEVEGTRLRVRSVRTRLSVHPDQLALAQRFAEVQRARSVRDVERRLELDELRHLRDTLLADPSNATVWWFRRHQDEPERIPEMAEHFHRAAAAIDASRRQAGEQVAAVLDELLRDTGRDGPWQLLPVLRHALDRLGRPDLAAQLPRAAERSEPAEDGRDGAGGRHRVTDQGAPEDAEATEPREAPAEGTGEPSAGTGQSGEVAEPSGEGTGQPGETAG